MRYIRLLLTVLLLCLGMGARADNIVSMSSAQGAPGEEVCVSISLANSDVVSSLQLSIPLDENLTLVEESKQLGSRCSNHSLTVGVNNGVLQVFVYSMSMAAITGNNGEVATFRLKLGNQPKTCNLTPSKTILTNTDGESVTCSVNGGTATIVCAKAEYNVMEVDFGEVPIRSTYTQSVSVTNVGNADLVINSMIFSDINVFSTTTALPLTISPGASKELNITYAPIERGKIERTLKVDCNSTSKLNTIKLKAKPFAVNELHVQPVSGISDEEVTVSMTMNNMDDISGYQVNFELPEQLEYVDGSFILSNRKQDHQSVVSLNDNVLRIIVFSQGDKPLIGTDGEIGSFKVKLVGRNGVELKPSKAVLSATIDYKVDNVLSAVYGGMISINSPRINISNALAFGAVSITENAEKSITVRNNGSAPLKISRVLFDIEGFSIKESLPMIIEQNGRQNLTVVCERLEQVPFETMMRVYSNDPDQRLKEVKVTGSRYAPNSFSVETPDIFVNENLTVNVSVNNYDVITGLQFDMTYPNGFEPFEENYTLESRAAQMTIASRQIDEHTLRYFCYFLSGAGIGSGDGKVLTLLLRPKEGVVPEGNYSISVKNIKMSTSDLDNKYAGTDINSSFLVRGDPSRIILAAQSYSRVYGTPNPSFKYKSSSTDLVGIPEIICGADEASPVGTYDILISKGSVTNDNVFYSNGKLTITKAPLIIMAKSYTIKQGEAIPEFEALYSGFKNGETSEILTTQPSFSCSAVVGSEKGSYGITVSGAEAGNYDITFVAGTLTVTDADPVVVTAQSYTRVYGDPNPAFEYTSSGAELVGTPVIVCEADETSPVGTYDILISKGSVTNYNDSYEKGTLTITKAPLTVTAKSYTIKQGEAIPEFEALFSGFKNEETSEILTTQPFYNCSAEVGSEPGTYEITVSGAEAGNYDITFVAGILTMAEADAVVVTAKNYTRVYGDSNPTFEYTSSGAELVGTPEIVCEADETSPVGTYDILISKGSVTNYNDSYEKGTLTITKAPLTVTAKSYAIKQGEAIPTFEAEYSGFKNDETYEVLTTQPSFSCSAEVGSEKGSYGITVSGAEAGNYDITFVVGTLTVTDADPVVVTAQSYTRVYGDPNPTFEYTSSGAELVGTPVIVCEADETSPVGTYDILISKGSVTNYNDSYEKGTLTITKAPLTVTAKSYTIKQGEAIPTFDALFSGFKNEEMSEILTTQPSFNCSVEVGSELGSYGITVSGAEAGNYEITYVDGILTVAEADAVVVTAQSYTRVYGDPNPTFEYTSSGVELVGTPEIVCEADETSPVGTYDILISKGSVTNYNDSYEKGTLTITKAPLTVTAKSYTIKQGEAIPTFDALFSGFKNEETSEVLTTQPSFSCSAEVGSEKGSYGITVSGAEAGNYDITFVAGTLTVAEADAVVVTAQSYTRVYGDSNPTFEYISSGAELVGTPEIICEANETSPVGTYDIIVRKGGVTNYNDSYEKGTLTITKAPLTVTAKSYAIKQGEAIPTFEAEYSGFKNDETYEVLTTQPSFSCSAVVGSEKGSYGITVSGAEAGNYDITFVVGTLTVTDADPVVVTAQSYTRVYGDPNPTFKYTSSGAELVGIPVIVCEADETSPVGTYDIIVSKGSVTNYNDSYEKGMLTIKKAPLNITAKSYIIKQGEAIPTFEALFSGFKNEETSEILTTQPSFNCSAEVGSEPGIYEITVSGAEAGNYDFTYVKGTLTVTGADVVVVTAKNYMRVYGDPNPTFEYTSSGAELVGTPVIVCDADELSPVGTYDILISKGSVTNYNDLYVKGVLTITKAPLSISVGNYTRKKDKENPKFVLNYEGFKNDETEEVLTMKPTVTTTATKASPIGNYSIEVSGAEAQNYEITYVDGMLTVEFLSGDANSDGILDKRDLNAIASHIMGDTPDNFDEEAADLNGDDKIDAVDIVELANLLGK